VSIAHRYLSPPYYIPALSVANPYITAQGSTIGYEDGINLTSGKSTQKAFIFMPYKNPAKLSLNRAKLSCMSCKCMKLASRSAIESDSSAKASSSDSSGEEVV
jgi:hypothetical protein